MNDPFLGTQVARYRIVRLLGEGGMGRVYLAVHPDIGSRVAIKVLSAESAGSPELVQRFFDEARAVNLIAHDNIVGITDLARLPNGMPYIVMEYVQGNTLRALIDKGPLPIAGLLRVGSEVLQALDAVHAAGIVHRDLKPDNVMVTLGGHAKVLDFGIAKLTRDRTTGTPRTRTGAMLGTPDYMAPEQIRGWDVDARTDLYAMGLLLYEAATGRRPFMGESDFEVMDKHLREEPVDPRTLRPDLPAPLASVILATLAKSPIQRFQSARAMANALGAIAPGTYETWDSLASRTWRSDEVPLEVDLRNAATQRATVGERPAKKPTSPRAKGHDHRVLRFVLVCAVVASACAVTYALARRTSSPTVVAAPYEPTAPPPAKVIAPAEVTVDAGPPVDAIDWAEYQIAKSMAALPSFPASIDPTTFGDMKMFAKDYDPAHLDPSAYYPRAVEHARAVFPDAKLVYTTWIGVTADGLIEFNEKDHGATYYFESAEAAKGPRRQPCSVLFGLSTFGMAVVLDDDCESVFTEPHCTAAELHARTQAEGMPKDMTATMTLHARAVVTKTISWVLFTPEWAQHESAIHIPNPCR